MVELSEDILRHLDWYHVTTHKDDETLEEPSDSYPGFHTVGGWQQLRAEVAGKPIFFTICWIANANGEDYSDLFDFKITVETEYALPRLSWDEDGEDLVEVSDLRQHDLCTLGSYLLIMGEVREVLPSKGVDNISDEEATMNDETNYEDFQLRNSKGRDVAFEGVKIAEAESSDNNASSYYSGSPGRSRLLRLYRTKGGKYVCQQVDMTCWQGERNRSSVTVCDTTEGIVEFFGHDWLAKMLYDDADIDHAVRVG